MSKKAIVYRLVAEDHLCPWGIKAVDLLKRQSFKIDDHHLKSSEESERYKEANGVDETPQVFIGEDRFNYDELREHFGLGPDPKEGDTYQPVVAVFAVTLAMALGVSWLTKQAIEPVFTAELFVGFSMAVLGILKLQNLLSFATGFVQYDLLAQRYVPYSYVYPFIEAGGGVLMIAGLFTWVVSPIVLIASTLGAVSVFKAVYIEKRDLHCACVGGSSSVPLGFISLTENLIMMAMAVWLLLKLIMPDLAG